MAKSDQPAHYTWVLSELNSGDGVCATLALVEAIVGMVLSGRHAMASMRTKEEGLNVLEEQGS